LEHLLKKLKSSGNYRELRRLALAIENLLDTSDLSLEDVTGRLKATKDHLESPELPREQGKLLLTVGQ
jgi:hypothetical protein